MPYRNGVHILWPLLRPTRKVVPGADSYIALLYTHAWMKLLELRKEAQICARVMDRPTSPTIRQCNVPATVRNPCSLRTPICLIPHQPIETSARRNNPANHFPLLYLMVSIDEWLEAVMLRLTCVEYLHQVFGIAFRIKLSGPLLYVCTYTVKLRGNFILGLGFGNVELTCYPNASLGKPADASPNSSRSVECVVVAAQVNSDRQQHRFKLERLTIIKHMSSILPPVDSIFSLRRIRDST